MEFSKCFSPSGEWSLCRRLQSEPCWTRGTSYYRHPSRYVCIHTYLESSRCHEKGAWKWLKSPPSLSLAPRCCCICLFLVCIGAQELGPWLQSQRPPATSPPWHCRLSPPKICRAACTFALLGAMGKQPLPSSIERWKHPGPLPWMRRIANKKTRGPCGTGRGSKREAAACNNISCKPTFASTVVLRPPRATPRPCPACPARYPSTLRGRHLPAT